MKQILAIFCLLITASSSFAQVDKEEREEKKAASKQKVEYTVFRRQILALPEYTNERKKIPELQKAAKQPVKLSAWVDSTADAGDSKTLVGFIRESAGDISTDIFEVTYDRALKKITAVKPTGETLDIEKEEKAEKEPAHKKPSAKKADDDDDDDAEDAKPARKGKKDPDDE